MDIERTFSVARELANKDKRIPLGLMTCFIILFVWSAINLVNLLTLPSSSPATKTEPNVSSIAIPVSSWHLFGKYDASLANLPQTQLPLTLEGTITTPGQPNQATALIQSNKQTTQLYRVGQTLPGGATITRITTSRVIINNGHHIEELVIPIKTLPGIQLPHPSL